MDDKRFASEEYLFYSTIQKWVKELEIERDIDVVIGIPFYNEQDTLIEVIKIAQKSLNNSNIKKLIVCVGDPAGEESLKVLKQAFKDDIISFLMPKGKNGRGCSIRAIFEVARIYEADVILLEADLQREGGQGIKHEWVERLAKPILGKYDMAVATFRRHHFEDVAGKLLVSPLIYALYGTKFEDPLSGVFAFSHDLVEGLCSEYDQSVIDKGGYGINPWLLTTALKWKKNICEVKLGAKMSPASSDKKKIVFKEMSRSLFDCVKRDEEYWIITNKYYKKPDILEIEERIMPLEVVCNPCEFVQSFLEGYDHYKSLLHTLFNDNMTERLEKIAKNMPTCTNFPLGFWAEFVYEFLLVYSFQEKVPIEDLIQLFSAVYDGMIAGFLTTIMNMEKDMSNADIDLNLLVTARVNTIISESEDFFLRYSGMFIKRWKKKIDETAPFLTPLDYLEFIPGVPIVLPKRLKGKKRDVSTGPIFRRLQKKYEFAFKNFLQGIGINSSAKSAEVISHYKSFMDELERTVDILCPGNLYTEEGTEKVINSLFEILPHKKVLVVKWQIMQKLLSEFPPRNLILRLKFRSLGQLLNNMDVRDVLTLAHFTEDKDYLCAIFHWLQDNLRPDSFEQVELKPMVVSRTDFPGMGQMREISDLNRLTAQIAIMNLGKGMGGDYPKLRYFTRIAKSIIEAEHFSMLWESYARERKEVGRKFVNSIVGHYGKALFSAHHVFENWHHREFKIRLKKMADELRKKNMNDEATNIQAIADGHGLSLVLRDGTFLPCSAWTWASFSFKGGEGVPTPLFLHVERDWFNNDLLEEIYRDMGYNPNEIMQQVFTYISQGRESINLADVMLGIKPPRQEIIIQEQEYWPHAQPLQRYKEKPILTPIKEHSWESRFVLNTAALRLNDKVYLLYRAYGDDEISRIGLAISDGYSIIERLDQPIFFPETDQEKRGCEDPRVVIVDDELFMLYTAYDGVVAQIAAASIPVEDFLSRNFSAWKRRGLAFPGLWDKDAILFPEKFKGRYVIYHRIEPSIWIAYSDELLFPWPRVGHKIILGPRSGMMWDSLKIGAGAQPIKTRYGWLLIYHGVDKEMVYRLGVILADLEDPGRILYRSPNAVLEPQTECELGRTSECWIPNVVFTCGAVSEQDKEILDDDDKILVYYGAADTSICLATGKVVELIPEEVRARVAGQMR
ncbi:MAG: glycosidase [Tepidanaerobacteraceae bacterium]